MELLIEWITQILIFLLLASVIDLLIPKTTMKKYIHLVLGLILLLIFLKPFFSLFQINFETALEPSIPSLFNTTENEESIENSIEFQKKEIQASQDAYILEQMENHLKSMAHTPLSENYQLEISDIQFNFQEASMLTYEDLEKISVYLKESEAEKGVVSAVDEVVINTEEELEDNVIQHAAEIKSILADLWQFEKEKISIEWEGGTF